MDFTYVLKDQLLELFIRTWAYLLTLVLLVIITRTAWFKGLFGESLVNISARRHLDRQQYRLINNVTLPTDSGTTQIDHIIVSRYGVFVVETKNMKGWIFGSAQQKQWTQKIYSRSHRFQNPLHQNYKHLKTLQQLLDLTDKQIHSVVVFVGDSTFKTPMPTNVTQGGGYLRYIKSFSEAVLNTVQVEDIIQQIESERVVPGFGTNREHVRHVKEIVVQGGGVSGSSSCDGVLLVDGLEMPGPFFYLIQSRISSPDTF